MFRDSKKIADFNRGMAGVAERPLIDNIILHCIIRIKFFIQTGFGLIPIFASNLSGYTSDYRPKDIPQMDYFTLFAIRMMWAIGAGLKNTKYLLYILIKLRIMHKLNDFYFYLMVTLQH